MKLLLDQGLPRTAVRLLSEAGVETIHVGDIGYATADDADIIEFARQGGFVIVTLDADFHALLMVNRETSPSVIRLRLEGLKGKELAAIVETVLPSVSTALERGALVTVTRSTVRVHRLK